MIRCAVPPGKEWDWTKTFEQSIKKWDQNIGVWCRKAIAASDDPPKSKHVRRIVLALIRDPIVTLYDIFKELFSGEEWKTDPRISAKAFYVLLVCAQFSENFPKAADIIQAIKKIIMITSKSQVEFSIYYEIVNILAKVLEAKMAVHYNNTNVSGNLYISGQITEPLSLVLFDYAKVITPEFKKIVNIASSSQQFLAITLVQPIADEASFISKALKYYNINPQQSKPLIQDIELSLKQIENMPYLDTAILSPSLDEGTQPNYPRYPSTVLPQ